MENDQGINFVCFFCGSLMSGISRESATKNALEGGWGRYKHSSYSGKRWVCKSCSHRHHVYKSEK